MSVAFQKIISPSSATFPGRRGSNQAFFSPSLSLCSPLMPPNQPGGDIIILEPGVTVGRTPGAGSLVCECVCMYVCFCVHVCAWQPGSLWPHHHCVSQPQPVQTCTLSCQPQCTFSVSHSHTHTHTHTHTLAFTLTGSRYPVEKGKTPGLTYVFGYCQ